MTNPVRIGLSILALVLAGLVTGCTSQPRQVRQGQPANDFEIVETSTRRQLSAREMAYLRAKVADYLVEQGETGSGDYYVKIYLGEEVGVVEEGEWVVVRYTRYPAATTYVFTAEPDYLYPSYGYSTFDYSPFGWLGFGAFSFWNLDNPYYHGYHPYLPRYGYPRHAGGFRFDRNRWDHRRHDHDKKYDRDRKHDRDRDDDKRRGDARPRLPGPVKPTFIPANVRRERWNDLPTVSPDNRSRDTINRRFRPEDGSQVRRWERRNEPDTARTRGTGFAPERPTTFRNGDEVRPRQFQRPGAPNRERERVSGTVVRPADTGAVTRPRPTMERERNHNPVPRTERPERSGVSERRGRETSRPEPAPRPEPVKTYERPAERPNANSERSESGGGRGRGSNGRRGDLDP